MNDITKIVHAFKDSNILLKAVTKTIKNETKEQKGEFLGMLLGTLGASLLENMLAGKGIVRTGSGKGVVRDGSGKKKEKEFRKLVMETKWILNATSSFNKL